MPSSHNVDADVDSAVWDALVADANCLVDSIPEIEADCGIDKANAVAKYLAAHFITIRDPRQKAQSTLEASDTFESDTDLGLDSSRYGQTAKLMDCTGILSKKDTSAQDGAKPTHIFKVCGR